MTINIELWQVVVTCVAFLLSAASVVIAFVKAAFHVGAKVSELSMHLKQVLEDGQRRDKSIDELWDKKTDKET